MNEYVTNSMHEIPIPRGFLTHTEELSEDMMSKVISSNGRIGWAGCNGKPELAAGHSIIAGGYKNKLPTLVSQCNACVKQARDHPYELRIWSIPVRDLREVIWTDSSFDFSGERHQQGWIIGFTVYFMQSAVHCRIPESELRDLRERPHSFQSANSQISGRGFLSLNLWLRIPDSAGSHL